MSTLCCASALSLQAADANKPSSNNPTSSVTTKAEAPKVAYVDVRRIITADPKALPNASAQWREEYNRIQKLLEPAKQELEDLKKKLEKGAQEFQSLANTPLASDEAKARKYEEVSRIEREYYAKGQDLDNFAQNEFNKAQVILGEKLEKVVHEIATAQGWDVVQRADLNIFTSKKVDLTDQVLSRLNKDYAAAQAAKEAAKKAEATKASPAA